MKRQIKLNENPDSKNLNDEVNYFESLKSFLNTKIHKYNLPIPFTTILKFAYVFFSIAISFISILSAIVQSFYDQNTDPESEALLIKLEFFDLMSSYCFIVEFIITYFIFHKGSFFSYIFTLHSLADLISISSGFINYYLYSWKIQMIRIFKLFKLQKLFRLNRQVTTVSSNLTERQKSMLKFNIDPIQLQIFNLVYLLFFYFFIGAGIILVLRDVYNDAFNIQKINFIDAVYMMIITSTTIGYGDIIPTNPVSRSITVVSILCAIYIISDQLAKITSLILIDKSRELEFKEEDHLIVIYFGNNLKDLSSFINEIKIIENKRDILILSIQKEKENNLKLSKHVFVYFREEINENMFVNTNLQKAKAIFIISRKYCNQHSNIDYINESIHLMVSKLAENVPVYAENHFASFDKKKSKSTGLDRRKQRLLQKPDQSKSNFIPISKIKQNIIAKSLINPGFSTFIQNLLFNRETITNFENEDSSSLISQYKIGCKYKIKLLKCPEFFLKKNFREISILIYKYSKIISCTNTNNDNNNDKFINRPIITIGILMNVWEYEYLKKKSNEGSEDLKNSRVLLYPTNHFINNLKDEIIVIANDDMKLENFAEDFDSMIKSNNEFANKKSEIIHSTRAQKSFKKVFTIHEKNNIINNFPNYLDNLEKNPNEELIEKHSHSFNMNENQKIEIRSALEKKRHHSAFEENLNLLSVNPNINSESPVIENVTDSKTINNSTKNSNNPIVSLIEQKCFNDYGVVQTLYNNNISQNENYLKTIIDYKSYQPNRKIHDSLKLKNHIIIIGFQERMYRLLEFIQYHHKEKIFCIVNNNQKNAHDIHKLLVHFKNLYHFNFDPCNINDLVKININKAFKILYLIDETDSIINENINNLISYRCCDDLYNLDCFIELSNDQSTRYLGNSPLNGENNKFLHPLFLSGSIFYNSYLDKLVAQTYSHYDSTNIALKLIDCGYTSFQFSSVGNRTKKNVECPVIITIKIPDNYINQKYHKLFDDLINLDTPCMPLGIYIKNPFNYARRNSNEKSIIINEIDQSPTSENKKVCENDYMVFYDKLEKYWINNKPSMNFVDLENTHLPIFITNPDPEFIIKNNTYVQLLCHHEQEVRYKMFTQEDNKMSLIAFNSENFYKSCKQIEKIYSKHLYAL